MNDIITDPEFLKWEASLVGHLLWTKVGEKELYGGEVELYRYSPGPNVTNPGSMQYAGPMFSLKRDVESDSWGAPLYHKRMTVNFSELTPEQEEEDAIW